MMPSLSPILEKGYVDRGVQTDLYPQFDAVTSSPNHFANLSRFSDLTWSSPATASSRISHFSNAYTNSFHQQTLAPGQLSLPARRLLKQPQLPLNRPSSFNSQTKQTTGTRVSSLPESIPIYSVNLPAPRVVSLPDNLKAHVPAKSRTTTSSSRTENSLITESSSSFTSIVPGGDFSRVRMSKTRRGDILHTPSPPSSPDSIMIIGNNSQVPRSFLPHKNRTQERSAQVNDDVGWITWASSPPRPIPSLHGPLSLPYARCPSGAEGTIVEGPVDLSRTVWGAETARESAYQTHPFNDHPDPSSLYSRAPTYSSTVTHNVRPTVINGQPVDLQHRVLETIGSRGASDAASNRSDSRNTLLAHDRQLFNMEGGLGIAWNSTPPLNAFDQSVNVNVRTDSLKSSAPVFIPSQSTPRIFIEPRSGGKAAVPPRRLSAIEIAQQYRKQQDQITEVLPTPPTPFSVQRTLPVISQQVSSTPDLPTVQELLQQQLKAQAQLDAQMLQLDVHRRQLEAQQEKQILAQRQIDVQRIYMAECLNQADNNAYIHQQQQDARFKDSGSFPLTPESPFNQDYRLGNTYQTISCPASTSASVPENPARDRTAHAIALSNPQYNLNPVPSTPLSPVSPEVSTNNTYLHSQQPRSVPMARLMRRRLSSVAEESSEQFSDKPQSPPPSPVRAFHYRNQFSSSQPLRAPIGPGSLDNNFIRSDGVKKPNAPFARLAPKPLVDMNHSEVQSGTHMRFGSGETAKPSVQRAVSPQNTSSTTSNNGDFTVVPKKKASRRKKTTTAKSARIEEASRKWLNDEETSPWRVASSSNDADAWL